MFYVFTDGEYYAPLYSRVEIQNIKEWMEYIRNSNTNFPYAQPVLGWPSLYIAFKYVRTGDVRGILENYNVYPIRGLVGKQVKLCNINDMTIKDTVLEADDYVVKSDFFAGYRILVLGYESNKYDQIPLVFDEGPNKMICTFSALYNTASSIREVVPNYSLTLHQFATMFIIDIVSEYDVNTSQDIVFWAALSRRYGTLTKGDKIYHLNLDTMNLIGPNIQYRNLPERSKKLSFPCPFTYIPDLVQPDF